jgi:hypothetical protein
MREGIQLLQMRLNARLLFFYYCPPIINAYLPLPGEATRTILPNQVQCSRSQPNDLLLQHGQIVRCSITVYAGTYLPKQAS